MLVGGSGVCITHVAWGVWRLYHACWLRGPVSVSRMLDGGDDALQSLGGVQTLSSRMRPAGREAIPSGHSARRQLEEL